MKVLKDPDDLFRAMNRKEREYQRDFTEADKEDEIAMADEEREKKIVDEKKARAEAVALLCRALQAAGVPLLSLKIIEDGSDCTVEAMFKYGARHWGVRYADINTDAPQTALWDILRQIPELR